MSTTKNTYKKGLKGIAVFGSLQIYKILLSVLTTKVSAIFLGPAGSGIYGLLTSTLLTVESFTSCGLGTSAVKDIAQANSTGNTQHISKIYTVLNKLVWITGIIGTVIIALFAPFWSRLAFGNSSYSSWFILISITLLINQLVAGQGALLTGLQKYKLISKLRLYTGALTAVASILFYYFMGINGIIPVILSFSLIHLIVSLIIIKPLNIKKISLNIKDVINYGKPMFTVGISLGISWALTNISGYFIRIYISSLSNVATVGLFTASFSLVNTYLGLIFSSIESDFFPRLSKASTNLVSYKKTMIEEIELLLIIIIPLVGVLILFSQPVLNIFYSSKFIEAKSIICWTAFSMIFKVPSWAMSIGLISKGRTKLYLYNQISFIIYQLILNLIGFKYLGLTGLGISYVIAQIVFTVQNLIIQHKIETLFLSNEIIINLMFCLIIGIPYCIIVNSLSGTQLYLIGISLLIPIVISSLYFLNKKIHFFKIIKNKLNDQRNN